MSSSSFSLPQRRKQDNDMDSPPPSSSTSESNKKRSTLISPTQQRAWSIHETTPLLIPLHSLEATSSIYSPPPGTDAGTNRSSASDNSNTPSSSAGLFRRWIYYVVYALVNVIISVPGLYGYAAVIFNHPVFASHRNALSKLVIFSSLMMQLSFTLFSSMDFAIGTVQDAGLIFLSSMANTIANEILSEMGDTEEDDNNPSKDTETTIVSTTLVLLSLGTALLGIVLILIGKFQLTNAVSYLPMPVVGGYLAYIGYFCIQAGVALCISQPLTTFADWLFLVQPHNLLLAVPGLLAGLVLTLVSRLSTNDVVLPLVMVAIPALFYIIIYWTGAGLEGAREQDWVGDVAPPVPVTDLFGLVDFGKVRWDLIGEIGWTWVGMVFVVSFASCLDVAAISMDKGEALDTNRELATVGIGNLMSGLTFGFTGSYIFSQTIFTYRTGIHSRWIGILIMVAFLYIVVSPINILEICPLFFFGATLIFIGYDLVYEWLIEIRPRVLLSEYGTIWATFISMQIVGIDFGIIFGVIFAILDNTVASAQTTAVRRVQKRSRAFYSPAEHKILQKTAYHGTSPMIVVMDIIGTVFFGSSLGLLDRIVEEVGLEEDEYESSSKETPVRSPHTSSFLLMSNRPPTKLSHGKKSTPTRRPPLFVVIDLNQVANMDASAARTCFLQLTAMCKKRGMVVCCASATPRMDWILRSHGVSYSVEEEEQIKAKVQQPPADALRRKVTFDCERILLFVTVHEALEFCEHSIIHMFHGRRDEPSVPGYLRGPKEHTLSSAFARILDSPEEDKQHLERLDGQRYHEEVTFNAGEKIFAKGAHTDSFFVVLAGAVAADVGDRRKVYRQKQILSGAGVVSDQSIGRSSRHLDPAFLERDESAVVATLWPVCGVFGYSDLLLDCPRTFSTMATQNGTKLAKVTHSHMNLLAEDPILSALVHRVLLRVSVLDLQNCTCSDV